MSITITISEETEEKIRRRALSTGLPADKIVGDLVEEVWDEHFPQVNESSVDDYESPLAPFIGMFSSGITDTSVRYKEILLEDVKMPGGFSND